jgi:hypothetical protein
MIKLDVIYFDLTGCETSVTAPSRCSGPFPFSLLLRRGVLMLVILFATMLAAQTNPADDFRCPESYATDAERDAAVKTFDENFAKQHPQATVDDLVAERIRLLVARDCRQTLANIADNRKPEKATLQIVSPQEQSLTMAGRRFTRVDEYYDSTTRVWSVIFVDDPQHPESFANQLILNFYDWTLKPTSEAVGMALSEEKSGTKNIFLFKAPDEPRGEMVYHIVSVTHTQSQANFVNVMSVAGWEKAAVNIDFSHRLGVGIDLHKTEVEARQWLLSAEGKDLRDAVAALRVGVGWHEYLKQVK